VPRPSQQGQKNELEALFENGNGQKQRIYGIIKNEQNFFN
jgi:hypothetical protein